MRHYSQTSFLLVAMKTGKCSILSVQPLGIALLWLAAFASLAADSPGAREFNGATPLQWSVRMADSEMARRGDKLVWKSGGSAKWDYTVGLFTLSLLKLDERLFPSSALDSPYHKFAAAVIGSFIDADGQIQGYKPEDYNLDNLNAGKTVLALYQRTKDDRYRKASDRLRHQLDRHPRTSDGGFWHKQRYPHQMWLDGLYMGAPFYAEYVKRFDLSPAGFDDVVKQFQLVAAHTYDPTSGLFYHGWDESKQQDWASKATGTSSNFWGRAIGWYGMAMVDVLDFLPHDHSGRAEMVVLLRKLAAGILKHQDMASGLWYQVMDQGAREGNYLEATASTMFVYTLAKGVNRGYLTKDFTPALLKGYQGIIGRLIKPDARGQVALTQCCSVAGLGYGRDGSYAYYLKEPIIENDLKGIGPFILAGLEVQELLGLPMTAAVAAPAAVPAKQAIAAEWAQLPEILARMRAPVFPACEFPITSYGAAADGKADCTAAIRRAIDACAQAGGGRVIVPAGQYLTGPIHLKSGVELHLDGGATLKFIPDPNLYLPAVFTRFEGMECYNYSPLIYAFEQQNIAVTGEGVLDGQADESHWWAWKGRKDPAGPANQTAARARLARMVEQGLPVSERRFGAGDCLRPSFIQPYRCRNVLIEGVRIRRSPMWEINPVLCTNVTVRGVNVLSHGPNNDGCDPESSRDVLIEDCMFDTGDDCIAIKSGRNNDGRRLGVPSENIVIRRCTMKDGHGGVVIGSEISGGCRNVFAEDCTMDSPNLDRVLRLKSNAVRGGVIENVFLRNLTIGQVADAVLQIDFLYEEGAKGQYQPAARNIVLENLSVRQTPRVLNVVGFPGAEIRGVRLFNSRFQSVKGQDVVRDAEPVQMEDCVVESRDAASLFNGRDLAGWVPMQDGVFLATNGNLRVVGGMGWLRSARAYTNFVLELEWRGVQTNYNSGVFVRAGLEGKPFPTDVWQVNLRDNALASLWKGPNTVLPSSAPKRPLLQWCTFRIEARGRKLTLDIDGRRAWEYNDLEPAAGFIGLQAEGKTLDFRNIKLNELSSEP